MKKAIYKIENKLNHKIYIGQSFYPNKRFNQHVQKTENYKSLIHSAINRYGEENFSFEILGWFEDYNEKEKYYIQFYRSQVPYGYNINPGGEEPPHPVGEQHPLASLTQEQVNNIIKQMQDWRIPRKTIIANNKITQNIFRHINDGTAWRREDLNYPIRPAEAEIDKYRVLYIQWLCCDKTLSLNSIGPKVGWARSSAKMINQGNNHYTPELKYPIRDNAEYNKQILSQKPCIDYLHFGE